MLRALFAVAFALAAPAFAQEFTVEKKDATSKKPEYPKHVRMTVQDQYTP